jgi:hypothetical protein
MTLGEAAELCVNCDVDEVQARGSDDHRRVRSTLAAVRQGVAAEIRAILPLERVQAAERVRQLWAATEAEHASLRALATYLIDELSGKRSVMYEVSTREMPERSLLCLKRNVVAVDRAWAFGKEFIALLRRSQLPQIPGRAGAFFCIYWGEVSEDGDGPVEWCRPVPAEEAEALAARSPGLTLRTEPAHQEAFVKIGDGQIDGADWQVVSRSLEARSEQQSDIRSTSWSTTKACWRTSSSN